MATVPNTTTFNLENVVDVINPTTDDLIDCFNDANSSLFNPSYSGSKNNLLNFRDYGGSVSLSPDNYTFEKAGGTVTVTVTAIGGAWDIDNIPSWVNITNVSSTAFNINAGSTITGNPVVYVKVYLTIDSSIFDQIAIQQDSI